MSLGRLFIVATPIGHLEDLSPRARRVLAEVALIAAEDTRHSRRLLGHCGIPTPLTSYHDHNESAKADVLLDALLAGRDVALITDAGTPCIADPGYRIVRAARQAGIPVVAVPGPSALVAALSVSGLPTDRFAFHGFFPRKVARAHALLDDLARIGGTHVFYEAPHRLLDTLGLLEQAMPGAECCLARELTKCFEETVCGSPGDLRRHFGQAPVRGECVLMVYLPPRDAAGDAPAPEALRDAVEALMAAEGLSRRDAILRVAGETGLPRNTVYRAAGSDPS